jgi:hypothetical protein
MSTASPLCCSECGQGLPRASRFCDQCGTRVVTAPDVVATKTTTTRQTPANDWLEAQSRTADAADANNTTTVVSDLLGLSLDVDDGGSNYNGTDVQSHGSPGASAASASAAAAPPPAHTGAEEEEEEESAYEDLFRLAGSGGDTGGGVDGSHASEQGVGLIMSSQSHHTTDTFAPAPVPSSQQQSCSSDGPVYTVTFANGVPATLEVGPDAYERATLVTSLPESDELGEGDDNYYAGGEEVLDGHGQRQMRVGDQVLEINGEDVAGDGATKIRERLAALLLTPSSQGGGGVEEKSACRLKLRRGRHAPGSHNRGEGDDAFGGSEFANVFDFIDSAEQESMLMIHNTKSAMYEPPDHMDMVSARERV